MYFEYETPVCSLVMMWSTPSSKYAHVVARSALAGGIGGDVLVDELAILEMKTEVIAQDWKRMMVVRQ